MTLMAQSCDAYPDADHMRCRGIPDADGNFIPCGWHCAACGEATGQYGHMTGDGTFSCQQTNDRSDT